MKDFRTRTAAVVLDGKELELLLVKCPRRDCGKTHLVQPKAWRRAKPHLSTRPCPFCFRVSAVPTTNTKETS